MNRPLSSLFTYNTWPSSVQIGLFIGLGVKHISDRQSSWCNSVVTGAMVRLTQYDTHASVYKVIKFTAINRIHVAILQLITQNKTLISLWIDRDKMKSLHLNFGDLDHHRHWQDRRSYTHTQYLWFNMHCTKSYVFKALLNTIYEYTYKLYTHNEGSRCHCISCSKDLVVARWWRLDEHFAVRTPTSAYLAPYELSGTVRGNTWSHLIPSILL